MKILVTGGKGQLGLSLKKLAGNYPDWEFVFTDLDELDITNYNFVDQFMEGKGFTNLINCAAYTAVDRAETDVEQARKINAKAVGRIAAICQRNNVHLVHLSTDYVFDGFHFRPYVESDTANPKSVYGLTKLEGEQEASKNCNNLIIIRSSWLYSEFGNNFLKTILRLSGEKKEIRVISDQVGTPTYAGDLAKAILEIISKEKRFIGHEIYHYSNEGVASWYDFAEEIVTVAGKNCAVIPISTEDYPLPASRPFYSVLSKERIKTDFGLNIRHWKESLKIYYKNFQEQLTDDERLSQ